MASEQQVPSGGEIFLDHVGWYAASMEAAASQFERLGFVLTPYTEHRNANVEGQVVPSGTANRCAMLERGYLELLIAAPGSDTPLARQLRSGLARYGGIHVIALTVADAEAEHARLARSGFDPQPVVHLRRPVVLAGGAERVVAFSVVRPRAEGMPEGRVQLLVQETPELVWRPELIAHDNAIEALTGVLVVVEDVESAAARFARFCGRDYRRASTTAGAVELDRGRIAFAAAGWWQRHFAATSTPPFIPSVALRSRDLDATRAYFTRKQVRLTANEETFLIVDAAEAAGAQLFVHAEGADNRWLSMLG